MLPAVTLIFITCYDIIIGDDEFFVFPCANIVSDFSHATEACVSQLPGDPMPNSRAAEMLRVDHAGDEVAGDGVLGDRRGQVRAGVQRHPPQPG